MSSPRRGIALGAVVAAGVAGLVDEVVWARALGFRLGTTTLASSLVLGLLVLGWGAGARFSGRSRRGLRLAAFGQGIAALTALVLPELALASAAWPSLLRDGLLLLLVLGGAFAMGLALPAWISSTEDPERRSALGGWNGWSSLGSTCGALLAGFLLLPLGGLRLAAGCSAVLHALAATLAWREARAGGSENSAAAPPLDASAVGAPRGLPRGSAAWLAFLSGFVSVAAQALALRWLLLCFLGFSHVFAAVGAIGLLAYAAGSFLGGWRWRAASSGERRASTALLLAAIGCGAAPFVLELVPGTSGSAAFSSSAPAWRQIAGVLLHAAAFLMVPVAGAAAWLTPASASLGAHAGARAGTALWFAGAGAAVAPLATHLLLVPALGSLRTALLLGALLAGSAACLGAAGPLRRGLGAALAFALVALSCVPSVASSRALYERSPVQREHPEFRLLAAHEDAVFAVAVVDDARQAERTLLTDNFRAAGTGDDYAYMAHLGSLPMRFEPTPRRVLVIAFGTGTTAGAVAAHAAVRELDIVEIAPSVLAERRAFRAVNEAVDAPPAGAEVRFHVADGRRFLEASDERWDAITLEPLLPYAPGAVHFYTGEFYALARAHLNAGGTLTHWIPATSVPPREVRALLRTFANAFAHAGLWIYGPSLVLVGSDAPLRFAAQSELDAAAWEDALCAVADRVGLLRLAAEPELRDAHPWIEFLGVRPSLERLAWYRDNLAQLLPIGDEAFADALAQSWQSAAGFAELWRERRRTQRALLELVAEEERAKLDRILAARGAAVAPPRAQEDESRLARWEALDRESSSAPTTRAELERRLADFYLRACVDRLQRAAQRAARFDDARALLREASGLADRLQRLRPQRFDAWLYGGAALFLLSADPALDAAAARRSEALAAIALRHAAALHPAVFEDVEARRVLEPLCAAWLPGGTQAIAGHLRAARELGERIVALELPSDLATLCAWIRDGAELDELYFRAFRATQIERALWTRRLAEAEPAEDQRAAFEVLGRWLPRARRGAAR
ncbi:MAG: fused MFS/spermidine synthase [Planctomycetes bacterium]|nr:fused MFS/spermidine synthase [Planctomycetota bacterium]